MKKKETLVSSGKLQGTQTVPFEFLIEPTEEGEGLLDVYVGVEFSILYEIRVTINKNDKNLKGTEKFYVTVPESGIDAMYGKAERPQEFKISHDKLD